MSYMMDRKSSKKPIEHAKKFLRITTNGQIDLKDEAYIQVLKQINGHSDYAKMIRGWNMLALLASCYVPSEELFYSLLNHLLNEIRTNTDKTVFYHANYVFIRLYKTKEVRRVNAPTDEEITCAEVNILNIIYLFIYLFSK
jgi:hypothetical protein